MNIYQYNFLKKLTHMPFIDQVWLFGSRARQDNEERSDIDLAIVCPQASSDDWQNVMEIIEEGDTLLKIDCLRFDTLQKEDPLRQNILQFKKVLYAKEDGFMEKEFWKDYFKTLGDAILRLREVVFHPLVDQDTLYQDAAIQRFEFCIELFWKVLKKFLAYEKVVSTTPREVLSKSFQFGLIDDEKVWLAMLDDRNITSHVYKEEEAHRVFTHIKTYYPVIQRTYDKLKERFETNKN